MKKIIINLFLGAFLLSPILFSSCSDDDGPHSGELSVFLKDEMGGNSGNIYVDRSTDIKDATFGIPLRASRSVAADINATIVTVDDAESLVNAYNKAHGSRYNLLPKASYTLINNAVSIRKGQTESNDSIKVSVNLEDLKDPYGYILPIKIDRISGDDSGVAVSSALNVFYLTVNNSPIHNVSLVPTLSGEIIDKTTWSATATRIYDTGFEATNAIDQNNNTSWFSYLGYGAEKLTVDMQELTTLKGLRITPNYTAFGMVYNPKNISVALSEDGIYWIDQGSLTLEAAQGNASAPVYHYIQFNKPFNCQYIRLGLINSYASQIFAGISELDAIK